MDPIADMIIRLKNASMARKASVAVPFSNLKSAIAAVLEREGFIGTLTRKGKRGHKSLEIELKYDGKEPRIKGVRRMSKLSRRIYIKAAEVKPVKRGFGRLIISTPEGVQTGEEARKARVGGEALFQIW